MKILCNKPLWHHTIVIFGLIALLTQFLREGYLLHGDFATVFLVDNPSTYYLKYFFSTWTENNYLGYSTTYYALMRLPFYVLHDAAKYLNLPYYTIIIAVYCARYLIYYRFLRFIKVYHGIAVLVSTTYTLSIFFLDRLGPFYIFFSSAFVPLYLTLLVKNLTSGKHNKWDVILLLISIWLIMTSMHITLISIYLTIIVVGYLVTIEKKLILRSAFFIALLTILVFLFVLLPLGSEYVSNANSPLKNVASLLTGAVYNYSRSSSLINTFFGHGVHYSTVTDYRWVKLALTIITLPAVIMAFWPTVQNTTYGERQKIYLARYACLAFLMLSSITLVEPYIGLLKKYMFGFTYIKDTTYFLFPYTLILYALLGYTLTSRRILGFRVYLLALLTVLISVNIYALNHLTTLKRSTIPATYKNLAMQTNAIRGRILILPGGWVTGPVWAKESKILSGFYQVYLSNHEIVTKSPVEAASIDTQTALSKLYACLEQNCRNMEDLIDDMAINQVILIKDAFSEDEASRYEKLIAHLQNQGLIVLASSTTSYNVYHTTTHHEKFNPVEVAGTSHYHILNPMARNNTIVFKESFNKNWYVFAYNGELRNCELYNGVHKKSCDLANILVQTSYIWKKPMFTGSHGIYRGYGNKWDLNQEAGYHGQYILYYKPQAYLYLGAIISCSTAILYPIITWLLNKLRQRLADKRGGAVSIG